MTAAPPIIDVQLAVERPQMLEERLARETLLAAGPTVRRVAEATALSFGAEPWQVFVRRRHASIFCLRSVAMAVVRQHSGMSMPEIGRRFGGFDHTTVLSAVRRAPQFAKEMAEVTMLLGDACRDASAEPQSSDHETVPIKMGIEAAARSGKGFSFNHEWPAAHEAILRKKAKEGLSAGQIAAAIGIGITRNAVIGKAKRLGIVIGRKRGSSPPPAVRQATKQRTPAKPTPVAKAAAPPPAPVTRQNSTDVDINRAKPFIASANANLVSIMDLGSQSCRWPFQCDDGETRYCGQRSKDGSWCETHGRIAFAGAGRPTTQAYPPTKHGSGIAMQREARHA